MTRSGLRLVDCLEHVLQGIERIERYVADLDEAAFTRSSLIQDAVIRNFEVIGEACRNIDRRIPDFRAAHPELSLGDAYRLRNAVIHGYFAVDLGIIWTTIRRDLPELRARVQHARQAAGGGTLDARRG